MFLKFKRASLPFASTFRRFMVGPRWEHAVRSSDALGAQFIEDDAGICTFITGDVAWHSEQDRHQHELINHASGII